MGNARSTQADNFKCYDGVAVTAVACNGAQLASSSVDGKIRIWIRQVENGAWTNQSVQTNRGTCFALAQDSRPLLAWGSVDGKIRLSCKGNGDNFTEFEQLTAGKTAVECLAFAGGCDKPLLASGSRDGAVKLWRTNGTNDKYKCFQDLDTKSKITRENVRGGCLAFACGDRPLLAVGFFNGTIQLWHNVDDFYIQSQELNAGQSRAVKCLAFAGGGHIPLLAAGYSGSGDVWLWCCEGDGQYKKLQNLHGHKPRIVPNHNVDDAEGSSALSEVTAVAFARGPLSHPLLASASAFDNMVRLWRWDDQRGKYEQLPALDGHSRNSGVHGLAFTCTNELASGSDDKTMRVWPVDATLIGDNVSTPLFSLEVILAEPNLPPKLREHLDALCGLVGLDEVKSAVALFAAFMSMRPLQAKGEWNNIALAGPPGTGKTLVARVLAEILRAVGLVEGIVDVSVSDLKAGFVGQTFEKTMQFLRNNRGRALFFDEANVLYTGGNDYGREAASAMIKFLEEDRSRTATDPTLPSTVIIVAGYEAALEAGFWAADEGLMRRFPHKFVFSDYSAVDLTQILVKRADDTPGLNFLVPETKKGSLIDAKHWVYKNLNELIANNITIFRKGESGGDGGLLNGGGMEVLLQRAQFASAASSGGGCWGQRINQAMFLSFEDFEAGMMSLVKRAPITTASKAQHSRYVVLPKRSNVDDRTIAELKDAIAFMGGDSDMLVEKQELRAHLFSLDPHGSLSCPPTRRQQSIKMSGIESYGESEVSMGVPVRTQSLRQFNAGTHGEEPHDGYCFAHEEATESMATTESIDAQNQMMHAERTAAMEAQLAELRSELEGKKKELEDLQMENISLRHSNHELEVRSHAALDEVEKKKQLLQRLAVLVAALGLFLLSLLLAKVSIVVGLFLVLSLIICCIWWKEVTEIAKWVFFKALEIFISFLNPRWIGVIICIVIAFAWGVYKWISSSPLVVIVVMVIVGVEVAIWITWLWMDQIEVVYDQADVIYEIPKPVEPRDIETFKSTLSSGYELMHEKHFRQAATLSICVRKVNNARVAVRHIADNTNNTDPFQRREDPHQVWCITKEPEVSRIGRRNFTCRLLDVNGDVNGDGNGIERVFRSRDIRVLFPNEHGAMPLLQPKPTREPASKSHSE